LEGKIKVELSGFDISPCRLLQHRNRQLRISIASPRVTTQFIAQRHASNIGIQPRLICDFDDTCDGRRCPG